MNQSFQANPATETLIYLKVWSPLYKNQSYGLEGFKNLHFLLIINTSIGSSNVSKQLH